MIFPARDLRLFIVQVLDLCGRGVLEWVNAASSLRHRDGGRFCCRFRRQWLQSLLPVAARS